MYVARFLKEEKGLKRESWLADEDGGGCGDGRWRQKTVQLFFEERRIFWWFCVCVCVCWYRFGGNRRGFEVENGECWLGVKREQKDKR